MTNLNANALTVLTALRANTEGCSEVAKDGSEWKTAYLDNARPNTMTVTVFRAALRSLSMAGFYKPQDDKFFGSVKL
jgi:hypothetical protein